MMKQSTWPTKREHLTSISFHPPSPKLNSLEFRLVKSSNGKSAHIGAPGCESLGQGEATRSDRESVACASSVQAGNPKHLPQVDGGMGGWQESCDRQQEYFQLNHALLVRYLTKKPSSRLWMVTVCCFFPIDAYRIIHNYTVITINSIRINA